MEIPLSPKKEYRKNIPNLHHGAYKKVYDKAMNSKSKAAAIKAKCLDCMGWLSNEVKNCPITYCPLYPHRPYKTAHRIKSDAPDTQI